MGSNLMSTEGIRDKRGSCELAVYIVIQNKRCIHQHVYCFSKNLRTSGCSQRSPQRRPSSSSASSPCTLHQPFLLLSTYTFSPYRHLHKDHPRRTLTSKSLLNASFRYSRDGNPLTDGRQAWRCVKRSCRCPGRLYTLNDSFHSLGKPRIHPADAADSNAAEARSKIKEMASTNTTSNHRIYCAVTGPLPADTLALLSSADTLKKSAQRARRKLNSRPRAPLTLADLHLGPEDCRTLRQADMLLYDNASGQRRVR